MLDDITAVALASAGQPPQFKELCQETERKSLLVGFGDLRLIGVAPIIHWEFPVLPQGL